jgi:hypothetical protein
MKKIYLFLLGLSLSVIAFTQSPTCSWYVECGSNTWLTAQAANGPKTVATAYYFSPGLWTNDTSAIDQLWDAIPGDPLMIDGYFGVSGPWGQSPSTNSTWSVPPTGYSSQAKLLYDADYLYILTKVSDPNSYLYNSNSGASTAGVSQFEVEVAPYDSIAPGYAATDYQDEFANWNSLGARKLTFFLDPIANTANFSGWIGQFNYVSGSQDAASNQSFYGCASGTNIHSLGYEGLLMVSFSWAMSNGGSATGGGTHYTATEGTSIAFNITNIEYDAATAASSFVQTAWSTNNNDIWATMLFDGKVLLGPDLPCPTYSNLLDSLGLLASGCTTLKNPTVIGNARILTNPVTDDIQFSAMVKEVKVIDLVGKTVVEADQTQDVNVSGLANGLYLVKYITENNVSITEKIVKN